MRLPTAAAKPTSTEDQQVRLSVVVIISLLHVEPASDSGQPGFRSLLDQLAVGCLPEIANLVSVHIRRHHQIQPPVAREIVHATPPGNTLDVNTEVDRPIGKARKSGLSGHGDGHSPSFGNALRMGPQSCSCQI